MPKKKEPGEDLPGRFRVILVGGLLLWAILYTTAYVQQESRLSDLREEFSHVQGELTGLEDELKRYIDVQNENHAYVMSLVVKMAEAGIKVPSPPPPPTQPKPKAPEKDSKNGS